MSVLTSETVIQALRAVQDPELHQDLVSLGMIERANVQDGRVDIKVNLTTPACPMKAVIERDVKDAVYALSGVVNVQVEFGATVRSSQKSDLPNIQHIILVGSGKGGVGKSSVASNIAASLAQSGAAVGLLDADVYGPSVGHMMGDAVSRLKANSERKMTPLVAHGVRYISMANLVTAGQALVWRGPMLHSAIKQFLNDVDWGQLDYLIVDLPPGTGDVQMTLAQTVGITGAVIVTTPQDVAWIDAARAIDMFRKNQVPVLGIIENMSYFVAPDTGNRYHIFGHGGAQNHAKTQGFFFLGEIPLDIPVREDSDSGIPVVLNHPESPAAVALHTIAQTLAGRISVQSLASLPML